MELSLDRNNFYVPTFRSTTVAKKSICQFWSDNSDLNEPTEFSTYEVKLHKIQPENLDQASRIDGMTPVALTLILARLRFSENQKTA